MTFAYESLRFWGCMPAPQALHACHLCARSVEHEQSQLYTMLQLAGPNIVVKLVMATRPLPSHSNLCSVQDPTQRCFTYVDIASGADLEATAHPAIAGLMGTFIGATESRFAVLESNKIGNDNIAVYGCMPDFTEEQALLGYTYVELTTGDSVTGIWQGPPAAHLLEVWGCVPRVLCDCWRRSCMGCTWLVAMHSGTHVIAALIPG